MKAGRTASIVDDNQAHLGAGQQALDVEQDQHPVVERADAPGGRFLLGQQHLSFGEEIEGHHGQYRENAQQRQQAELAGNADAGEDGGHAGSSGSRSCPCYRPRRGKVLRAGPEVGDGHAAKKKNEGRPEPPFVTS
jgi:hypothetical protein